MMSNLKKILTVLMLVSILIVAFGCNDGKQSDNKDNENINQAWVPDKTVTFYLYSGAGGDTDTAMRALAAYWQQKYGVTFNVVNMPGGAGGIAANYVYSQPSDGYTLFGMV